MYSRPLEECKYPLQSTVQAFVLILAIQDFLDEIYLVVLE